MLFEDLQLPQQINGWGPTGSRRKRLLAILSYKLMLREEMGVAQLL